METHPQLPCNASFYCVCKVWLDSGPANAFRCVGHHHPRHPSKTQFIFEQLKCIEEVAEQGVGRKSVSDTNPDFLIKSQSVEHKSGQLPLFFKYHLILFSFNAIYKIKAVGSLEPKTDYQKLFKDPASLKCCCTSWPTSLSSRPFPSLRFSRDPLSGWDTSSCAPIGQDATCFFELIGRDGKTHLWPRQKHAPGPKSWTTQQFCQM